MKTNKAVLAMRCACLLLPLPALAQQGMVMPPPAAQAIEQHLQQTRTREQREDIENKRAVPVAPRQATRKQPVASVKNPALTNSKEAPSNIQDLDDQALFDRPGQMRSDGKSSRRPTK